MFISHYGPLGQEKLKEVTFENISPQVKQKSQSQQFQTQNKQFYNKNMTEKSLQPVHLQFNSPTDTSVISTKILLESPCQMKAEQPFDIDEGKLCNQESLVELNSAISKKDWTPEEDELVYRLHNQYGNKWAIIAEQLKGRTDNCIKNHFYLRLRKGLRKINKVIEDSYSKQYKEFKTIDLYKVIEASDEKFKETNSYPNEMTDFGHDLKNRLFIFAEEESHGSYEFDAQTIKLLNDMNEFTKNYKRKSKKSRRYSPMGVGSVYRNNKKQPNNQPTETGDIQMENIGIQSQEKVKIQINVKVEQDPQKKQRKTKPKKQILKLIDSQKPTETPIRTQISILAPQKKQTARQITLPQLLQVIQEPSLNKTKSKNTYRQFSDDEGEQNDEAEYLRQQRLNHFAENILKTFKSYYIFKSFKNDQMIDDFIFQ